MVQNRKLVSIGGDTSDRLTKRYGEEKPKISFAEWVTEYLQVNLEKDDFLKNYAPFIEKIGITDNRLTLRDNKENKLTDIFMKDDQVYCSVDETTNCIHTRFAWALPELAKLKKD